MATEDPNRHGIGEFDVVVVGAGFGGLYATWRLRTMGLDVKAFESGDGVGGVWYHNRYPGARTDTPQEAYRLVFDGDPLADWVYTRRFPEQPEIVAYLEHVADRFDLHRNYSFGTAVVGARFDEPTDRWIISTDDGRCVRAKYFVTAVGAVSEPVRPRFRGMEDFAGDVYYTDRWPHENVDLTGRRIGLVGTGSTGVQITPHLARVADRLTVFQRTPNYVVPTGNREVTEADRLELLVNNSGLRRRVRAHPAGLPFERRVGRTVVECSPAERARIFDEAWERGGFSFLYEGFDDIEESGEANAIAVEYFHSKIREIVQDSAVAKALLPQHRYGAKRPPTGDDYYQSFNEPHVDLVDLISTPIEAFDPRGIHTTSQLIELDIIVFAIGFDVGVGAYQRMDIRGRDGVPLNDRWSAGPSTLLGISVHGFPNMFMVAGPHSALANAPTAAQHEVDWIAECIAHVERHGIDRIEPGEAAEKEWNIHVANVAGAEFVEEAVFANSWFVGANVDDRAPSITVYLGGYDAYLDMLDREADKKYASFLTQISDC